MHDIKWIRENAEEFDAALAKRGLPAYSAEILTLDSEKRGLIALIQELQHARKQHSKMMGALKDKASREFENARRDVEHINHKLTELDQAMVAYDRLDELLNSLPNLPDNIVPLGTDEQANIVVKTVGTITDIKEPKQHFELGEELNMMDFLQTAKMSGSRFVTLKGDLARLERALASFMLDVHTQEFGYLEISPPALVREQAMYNVGQLPKFGEDSFLTTDGYRLIPTAEVPLTNLVADSIVAREELPLRFAAFSPCFRSEAGSAGKDTRGMFRMHQFSKVELVTIAAPEDSEAEHQHMLKAAESILQKLELPYRVMLLCSGDMGFHSRRTYDLEVWLPGQGRYREISSCSNCGDFQARRMKARYKEFGATETTFLHSLNGSGLAIGRTIIAIMENYQQADGSIVIPKILQPYMGGKKIIAAKALE